MSDSYSRNCRQCGRKIQMRKMPAGQWVPFEGYDTVHNCQKPPVTPYRNASMKTDDANPYGSIGFGNSEELPRSIPRNNSSTKKKWTNSSKYVPRGKEVRNNTTGRDRNQGGDWTFGCFSLIGLVVFFQILSQCGN